MKPDQASKAERLDVRLVPIGERHGRIRTMFERLDEGKSLTVITDHEPRPLRLQFEGSYPGQFVWSQRHFGLGRWEATIRRIAPVEDCESISDVLRRSAVFAARAETRLTLAQRATERTYDQDASIVEQDVQWPYLGVVRAGAVAAIIGSPAGRDLRLFDVFPCETFGNVEMLDGGRTVARFVATSALTRVILIPRGIAMTAMSNDAEFARALATICAQRVRALAEAFSAQVTQPAIVRVAAAILPYAPPNPGLSPSLEPLLHMTQNQLAIIAGTAKEVAARAVAELEAAGALKRHKGHIALVDREKLQRLSEG